MRREKKPLELFANPINRVEERWGRGWGRTNTARAGPRTDRYKGRRRRPGTHRHARTDARTHAGRHTRCLQPRRAARPRLAVRDRPGPPARHWRGGSRPLTFHPPHPRPPLPLLPRPPSYPQSPAPAALVPRSSLLPLLPLPPLHSPRHSGKTREQRRLPREAPGRDRGVPVAAAVTAGRGRGRGGLGRV